MTREEFLRQFTDLIGAAFLHEGQDYGELLVSVYLMMTGVERILADEYTALREVFSEYGAKTRAAYEDDESLISSKKLLTMTHFEKSEVWRLVRRRPQDEWPDYLK